MTNAAPAAATAERAAPKTTAVYPAQPRVETELTRAKEFAAHRLGDRTAAARAGLKRMQDTHGNQAVLRMLGNSPRIGAGLNRKCSCGAQASGAGECAACAEKDEALSRAAAGSAPNLGVPPIVNEVLRSPGQPLDSGTRAFMEPRFGADLSGVRVQVGRQAEESAAAVNALAYTVGRKVVFGAGQYAPGTTQGRNLIAHELAHVLQQGGDSAAIPNRISSPDDVSEREADSAADAVMRMGTPALEAGAAQSETRALARKRASVQVTLQRKLIVTPADKTQFIAEELDVLCPGQLQPSGNTITQSCKTSTNQSCNCACDVAADPSRSYTIHVAPAAGSTTPQELWNHTIEPVPSSTLWPNTEIGDNPDISVESADSTNEFGAFKADGTPFWYPHWRILAHELCGHGRLRQSYEGDTGNRPQHDSTIDTENAIAAEHGEPARGHFADKRQGEAFYNPVGDRSKVVFKQKDGLHYEAP
jgi:hypothetical protein